MEKSNMSPCPGADGDFFIQWVWGRKIKFVLKEFTLTIDGSEGVAETVLGEVHSP